MLPGGPMGGSPMGIPPQMAQMGMKMGQMGGAAQGKWRLIFFGTALLTIASAVLGLISTFSDIIFSPFDIIIFCYLGVIGLVLACLDCPYYHPALESLRLQTFKFCLFLTRFIGRGVTYVFLGCMIMGNLWDNSIMPFLAILIWGWFMVVAAVTIKYGVELTRKLFRFRNILKQRNQPASSICPGAGLPIQKFGELALATCGVSFSQEELGFIASALSQTVRADEIISQREFEFWMTDSTPVLI